MGFYTMNEKLSKNVKKSDDRLFVGLILNVEKEDINISYVTHNNEHEYNRDLYLLNSDEQNLEFQKNTKPIGVSIFEKIANSNCVRDILTSEEFPLVNDIKPYNSNTGRNIKTFVAIKNKSMDDQNYYNLLFNMEKFNEIKMGNFRFDKDHYGEYDKEVYDYCTRLVLDYIEDYNNKNNREIKPKDIGFLSKSSLKVPERELYDKVEKKFIELAIKNTIKLNKKISIEYVIQKDIKAISNLDKYNNDYNGIYQLLKNYYKNMEYKDVFQYILKHNKYCKSIESINNDFYLNIIEKNHEQMASKEVLKENTNTKQKKVINLSTTEKTIEQIANEMILLSKMGNVVNAVYDDVEISTEFLNNEEDIIEYFFSKKYNIEPKNVKKNILTKNNLN